MTRREQLTLELILCWGVHPFLAQEAIASIAIEHPEWNLDEEVTDVRDA